MKFRTELKPATYPFVLDPGRPVVTLGSCFAENVARRMNDCMWTAVNPFGTLFNPVSIANGLKIAIFEEEIDSFIDSLFQDSDFYHSWLFGSQFSSRSKDKCIEKFRVARETLLESLESAEALFVTFGTSYVYNLDNKGAQYIVGNCHKQPSSMFSRYRLSVEEITALWTVTISLLRKRYPNLRIIFTVSPVRHLKDGFHENTLSKSILHLAVERLCLTVPESYYLPAYELLNDDLRDYRFYSSDLVHPSEPAIEYIWEYLTATLLDEPGRRKIREGEKKRKASLHRPLIE